MRNFFIDPGCCKRMQTDQAIRLSVAEDIIDNKPLEDWFPKWVLDTKRGAAAPSFCPYCGKLLPGIEPRDNPPSPIYVPLNGLLDCATCGQKPFDCKCWPPEIRWKVRWRKKVLERSRDVLGRAVLTFLAGPHKEPFRMFEDIVGGSERLWFGPRNKELPITHDQVFRLVGHLNNWLRTGKL